MKGFRLPALFSSGLLLWGLAGLVAHAQMSRPVVVVPITGTVDDGMAHLVERSVDEANQSHARAIVLDVNSPGGLVSSAFAIRDALFGAQEPVYAYVGQRAYSAAALISLAAGRIVMAPGASIGAAEPIPATVKMISGLRGEFESTAERNHRDPKIAGAMVDKNVDLPQYKRAGAILTLNTDDAVRSGIANGTAPSLDAALTELHLDGAPRVNESFTWAERIARFATDPTVSGLLLTLGMLGLLIEMQTLHGNRRDRGRRSARAVLRNARVRRVLEWVRHRARGVRSDRYPLGAARRSWARRAGDSGRGGAAGGRLVGVWAAVLVRRHRNDRDGDRADGDYLHARGTGDARERLGATSARWLPRRGPST